MGNPEIEKRLVALKAAYLQALQEAVDARRAQVAAELAVARLMTELLDGVKSGAFRENDDGE